MSAPFQGLGFRMVLLGGEGLPETHLSYVGCRGKNKLGRANSRCKVLKAETARLPQRLTQELVRRSGAD